MLYSIVYNISTKKDKRGKQEMSLKMSEVLDEIERRIHKDYERYGRRIFNEKYSVSQCNEMLVSRLERNYSNLEAFRETIHNMYIYSMIDDFDEFKECIDRVDELLKKLDNELDRCHD